MIVLGAGMAGLLSAWAIKKYTGVSPRIYTDRINRRLRAHDVFGIHILHDSCGLNIPSYEIRNKIIVGDRKEPISVEELSHKERISANEIYAERVYQDESVNTSLLEAKDTFEGFDFVEAYNTLANKASLTYHDRPAVIREQDFLEFCDEGNEIVVSSIPRPCITPTWIKHYDATVTVSPYPPVGLDWRPKNKENVIIYNVGSESRWTRASCINVSRQEEIWNTEYVSTVGISGAYTQVVKKVLRCDPYEFPENSLLVGRKGKWEKGYVASQAYHDTMARLKEIRGSL